MTQPAGSGTRRSPAKRAAILRAATEIFLSEGFARPSMDAIAAKAGVGKQTVYGHFGNKELLFLEVVNEARSAGGLGSAGFGAVAYSGDMLADLSRAGERLLDAVLAPDISALHRLTIAELPHHPELQRLWRDGPMPGDPAEGVARYLADRHEAGDLTVPDPALAARQFVFLLTSEGRVRTLHGTSPISARERTTIAHQVADLIVRAHRPAT